MKHSNDDLGTWICEYHLAGNLIRQIGGGGNLVTGDSLYREYNSLGQLIRVKEGNTSSGRIIEEYSYDHDGNRIKSSRFNYNGGTNETIYTPYREWLQVRNASGTYNFIYIYDGDSLVARLNPDGTKWFYHPDHLGSTSVITDEQGNVVEDEFYSPFGESLSVIDDEDYKLYTGQFKDTTGQYYYGARYYLPLRGQFISADPEIQNAYDPQFLNHYAYARNNPYLFIDPDGRNARFYLDKDAARVSGASRGHIVIGIDDPENPGNEIIFENTGLQHYRDPSFPKLDTKKSEKYRQFLSLWGVHDAETYEYSKQTRDSKGNVILPKNYDEYFEISQDSTLDQMMIAEGRQLNTKPWNYQAIEHNSQHYAGQILEAAGYKVKYSLVPKGTFEKNKDRKWVSSAYKEEDGIKKYVIWNKANSHATNGYCKKNCED